MFLVICAFFNPPPLPMRGKEFFFVYVIEETSRMLREGGGHQHLSSRPLYTPWYRHKTWKTGEMLFFPMILILDGNSEVGAYSLLFDLCKAFDSIESSHKS